MKSVGNCPVLFQFLYCAIGGKYNLFFISSLKLFQFLYGAIGGLLYKGVLMLVTKVSIPIWCDWWSFSGRACNCFTFVSIPIWCDWW